MKQYRELQIKKTTISGRVNVSNGHLEYLGKDQNCRLIATLSSKKTTPHGIRALHSKQ